MIASQPPSMLFESFGVQAQHERARRIVGAGLKMYLSYRETVEWLKGIRAHASEFSGVGVFVLPSFPALDVARNILDGTGILFGAQNTHWEDRGPFTGEVSPPSLLEVGCTFVEIGHAERRVQFGESDEVVRRKTAAVIKHSLVPLICVGELTKQPTDVTIAGVVRQMHEALGYSSDHNPARGENQGPRATVIAYEPVWAIGQVTSAPAEYVAPVAAALRSELDASWPGPSAILYGGSVRADEAAALIQAGVDGLFVGRAALDLGEFCRIVRAVASVA